MRCIGLDLAWSRRNPSGIVALACDAGGAHLIHSARLHDDASLCAWIRAQIGDGPALIAIDAPLRVPNQRGQRPAEAALNRVFGRYGAGAHPANRQLLERYGGLRGEYLIAALATDGFVHTPLVRAGHHTRQIIEVYPHAALVTLFDLPHILRYKARPHRPLALRQAELARLQQLLARLERATPALHARALLDQPPAALRGAAFKAYEDILDALVCAYVAVYLWHWGPSHTLVFGDAHTGAITTPASAVLTTH